MTTFAHNTAYRLTVGLLAVLAVVSLWVVSAQAHHEEPEQAHHEVPTQTHHEENT